MYPGAIAGHYVRVALMQWHESDVQKTTANRWQTWPACNNNKLLGRRLLLTNGP
jgi:hypothetical protein